MNDDRTSAVADAPWEEPRGPQVPNALQRIPPLAWIFIVVAIARLWMLLDTARLGPAPDPLVAGGVVTHAISSLAVLLTPAALFIRLPDALRSVRVLAFGLIAVAVAEVLEALGPGLQLFFDSVGTDAEPAPVGPVYLAYIALGSLIGLVGLVGVAVGLDRARRRPSLGESGWTKVVLLFAGFLVVTRLAESFGLGSGSTDSIASLYFWAATVIGVGTIVAWAYMVIVTMRGVTAGEQPTSAWGLGTLAGVMALLAYVIFAVMAVFVTPNVNLDGILFLASGLFAVGPASLLLAVAAGLPSLEPVVKTDED